MTDTPVKTKLPKKSAARRNDQKQSAAPAPLEAQENVQETFVAPAKSGRAWSVIVLSLLIGAGVAVALFYAALRSGTFVPLDEAGSAQVRALADRIAKIETDRSRLNSLENSANRFEATRNSLSALEEKQESDVHRIESTLRDIKPDPKLSIAPLQSRLDALERKLQAVSQVEISENERLLALAMSSLAMKEALDKGAAFSGEYAVVKTLMHGGTTMIDGLTAYTETGVPTAGALLARFPDAAKLMLRNELPAEAGFLDKTSVFFRNLVSVRKVGEVEGNDAEAILARTELRLQQNNAESAYEQYKRLPAPVQQAAPQWGKDLAARASADKLMRDLLLASAKSLQPRQPAAQE